MLLIETLLSKMAFGVTSAEGFSTGTSVRFTVGTFTAHCRFEEYEEGQVHKRYLLKPQIPPQETYVSGG